MSTGKKRVRHPKQQRGIETRRQIVQAAKEVFSRRGVHETSSKEIADIAGVSIGSFYAYFKDKKSLLLEVLDDYLEGQFHRIWEGIPEALTPDSYDDIIRNVVRNVFMAYKIAPDFHRETHAMRYTDPAVKRLYDREREQELGKIKSMMATGGPDVRVRDVDTAALIIQNAVESVVHSAMFARVDLEESRLIDELTIMIRRYVFQ
jgi:AcrR family transcriptional regulator